MLFKPLWGFEHFVGRLKALPLHFMCFCGIFIFVGAIVFSGYCQEEDGGAEHVLLS